MRADLPARLEAIVETAYAAVGAPSLWDEVLGLCADALTCEGLRLHLPGTTGLAWGPEPTGQFVELRIDLGAAEPAALHAWRPPGATPFNAADEAAVRLLLPHLARVARLAAGSAWRLDPETRTVLDALDVPCCLLDGVGRVLFANAAARTHFARGPLGVQGGRLVVTSGEAGGDLADAIAAACGRGRRTARAAEAIVPRRRGFPIVAIVSPVFGRGSASDPIRAVVHLLDGESAPVGAASVARLRSLFPLTRSEAEVAAALAQGRSIAAIAADREASVHTVKAQTRSILEKTQASRQVDLVRLQRLLAARSPDKG